MELSLIDSCVQELKIVKIKIVNNLILLSFHNEFNFLVFLKSFYMKMASLNLFCFNRYYANLLYVTTLKILNKNKFIFIFDKLNIIHLSVLKKYNYVDFFYLKRRILIANASTSKKH